MIAFKSKESGASAHTDDITPDFGSSSSYSSTSGDSGGPGLLLILLLIGCAIVCMIKWSDVVTVSPDGKTDLKPERKEKIKKAKERKENCFQYRLVANADGWYPCYLCAGGKIYLRKGFTWKIGETCTGKGRYTISELTTWNVSVKEEFYGHKTLVLQEEIEQIGIYPLHPENMLRPESERLIVPPGHHSLKLQ